MEYILVANTLKVKRSSVQGKVPLTSDLQLGELAVNTYDGKLYLKKDVGGVESIVDVSAGLDATGVLQLLKTVDGVGSGLDADLLDGLASSSANTASTIVSRDSSGNFSAGTITAALSGNASTATTLQTARTINGVSFNGSANITIADSTKLPLSGGTMTGAITFAAGQTWPTFNQNTTGSAGSLSSNTGYLVYRSIVADASIDTATQNGIYTRDYTGASASMLVWDAGGSTGTTQLDVNYGNSGAIRLRNKTDNTTWSNWRTFLTDQNYNSYSPTLTGGGASGTWGINVTGNAATVTNGLYSTGSYADPAWITSINYSKLTGTIPTWNQNTTGSAAKWTTARTLSFTGDATGSGSVDGSTNVATALTLANSGVTAGTYTKITVNAKGIATSGTTLATTDIPALDASKITTGVFDPARLPSYVDDVLEYANLAGFPTTGETGKIYVALDTNKTYRWSGTVYVYITSGAVDSVAGKTGVVTLTNADVGLGNVENKSSATIRGEITSTNVTSALGFTPYNSTNPNGYTGNTGTVTSVSGTGTASGLTLSGTVTSTGSLTLSGTVNALAAGTYGISISGNAATATTFSTTRSNYKGVTDAAVSGQLMWKNYGNGHTIFDASNSTSPDGGAVNSTNAAVAWSATYPTLMGWNGSTTYGVRVDSARVSDNTSGNAATATLAADSTLAGGLAIETGRNSNANRIVRTDANGYIQAGWINTISGDNGTTAIDRVYASSDGYIRYYTPANFRQVLDVPTRSGGNASGTWAISITGNAATATSATTAGSAPLLSNTGIYNWNASTLPTSYSLGVQTSFVSDGQGWPSFGSLVNVNTYSGGGGALQLYVPYSPTYGGTGLRVRFGNYDVNGGNSWTAFKTLLASDNYNDYAPTKTGGGASGTWGINITGNAATASNTSSISSAVGSGYTWTGAQYFQSNLGSTLGSLSSPPLQAYATGANAAFMSFHRGGAYAVNMGLDSDNVFRIGGWSAAANRFQMDMSGNLTMAGNVTAYSDEKLKKDWGNLPNNFIELLSKIKYGTYTRIDSNERQVGVSAQSLQKVLPEAVLEDATGTLAVSYGNAAMVSVVELAKEVVGLKAQIAELKALIMEK